jgi:GIY-YIG catalytic domain
MQKHCGLTFVAAEEPWRHEKAVIAGLDPPLNIVHGTHPFRAQVEAARVALRRDCRLL